MVHAQANLTHIDQEILFLGYHLKRIAMLGASAAEFAKQLAPEGSNGNAGVLTVHDATAIEKLLTSLSYNLTGANQGMHHLHTASPHGFSQSA